MATQTWFLDRVESYLRASGMSPTMFGKMALADPNFVRELRAGRSPSLRVAEKVNEFINDNPPQMDGAA